MKWLYRILDGLLFIGGGVVSKYLFDWTGVMSWMKWLVLPVIILVMVISAFDILESK